MQRVRHADDDVDAGRFEAVDLLGQVVLCFLPKIVADEMRYIAEVDGDDDDFTIVPSAVDGVQRLVE